MSKHTVPTIIDVRAGLRYDVVEPTSFAFSVAAARTSRQRLLAERVSIEPDHEIRIEAYGEGGTHQLVRVDVEPGPFSLRYEATVELTPDRDEPARESTFGDIPADLLSYVNPSRYCESDRLIDLAAREFGDVDPGYARVQAINDWVQRELVYEAGSSDASTSAVDVLLYRAGVCRDFAHVAISLCRALGIPARYVSAYGVGVEPPDFHGVFEAHLGGRWWLFDPTGMSPADRLVRIAVGRDAADAAFATFAGTAELTDKYVEVTVAGAPDPGRDEAAASTA